MSQHCFAYLSRQANINCSRWESEDTNIEYISGAEFSSNWIKLSFFLHRVLLYICAVLSYAPISPEIHSHHEFAVSFPWVCNSPWACCELFVISSWWTHHAISSALTVCVANSQTAHSKLTVRVYLVSTLWANWVSSKWGHLEIIQVSSEWVWC